MALAPVIIVGMHRSGTTMLARLLEELGLFQGQHTSHNHEALYFEQINDWLFRQANASWDNPSNFRFINGHFKSVAIDVIGRYLRGIRRVDFLGCRRALRYADIRDLDIPWGWKDPKNTFTVGIWKDIFPTAKILHIYRNPVDVAESLRSREQKLNKEFRVPFSKRVKDFIALRRHIFPSLSFRIQDIRQGVWLWEEYVAEALSFGQRFKSDTLHVKYESFLDAPERILEDVLSFVGLQSKNGAISDVVRRVRADRKYVFAAKPELLELYHEVKNGALMRSLGYDTIVGKEESSLAGVSK